MHNILNLSYLIKVNNGFSSAINGERFFIGNSLVIELIFRVFYEEILMFGNKYALII